MKRIEDIKEFKDIDTYYEISKIVDEVFQDRVEAHKHLVTANKEIERINNIINELEKEMQKEIERTEKLIQDDYEHGLGSFGNIRKMLNEERKNLLYKIKKLKGSNSNE